MCSFLCVYFFVCVFLCVCIFVCVYFFVCVFSCVYFFVCVYAFAHVAVCSVRPRRHVCACSRAYLHHRNGSGVCGKVNRPAGRSAHPPVGRFYTRPLFSLSRATCGPSSGTSAPRPRWRSLTLGGAHGPRGRSLFPPASPRLSLCGSAFCLSFSLARAIVFSLSPGSGARLHLRL